MSHDSCWLRDHQSGERQEKYLEDYAFNWRHKQKWQQPDAMDSGKSTYDLYTSFVDLFLHLTVVFFLRFQAH